MYVHVPLSFSPLPPPPLSLSHLLLVTLYYRETSKTALLNYYAVILKKAAI